jgi:hypothetical protein
MSHHPHEAEALLKSDAQLGPIAAQISSYLKPASDADIQATVAALKAKHGANVIVVNHKADALARMFLLSSLRFVHSSSV